MIEWIDAQLNRITMYRLVLYYLIFLLAVATLLSIAGILKYDPFALLFSVGFLIAACWLANTLFSKAFGVATNAESSYISALILALIITPISGYGDLWFLAWAAIWAMASKYLIAVNGKHIFNPVAFAVALTYLTVNQSASWWIGDGAMLPFVLAGGWLIIRRIRRFDLVYSFLGAVLATVFVFSLFGGDLFASIGQVISYSPLFFFAGVILTEPLTTPPTRTWRIVYGALVGFLFTPQFHIGGFYATPELALLMGNVLSYIVSPKSKLALRLKKRIQLSPDIFDFIFVPKGKLAFAPGQYMEWTLGMQDPDSRGNRRYFTLASSPTENEIRVGIKFYPKSSAFKQALLAMPTNAEITATQLAGDFTLPGNPHQKLVFVAGGIGITPFRSMLHYLLDTRQTRPITVLYTNKTVNDIVYVDVLERAQRELGIRTVYTVTDAAQLPSSWRGKVGRITPQMIKAEVPDYRQCIFYVSGPQSMVDSVKAILEQLHVPEGQIKTDYFAGLA
ncbi:MAG: RnfABCDGE type electron transport complex subunit D [Anaerolineae bacterium]